MRFQENLMRKILITVTLILGLLVGTAAPVMAALSGTLSCGIGKTPIASAWAYGKLKLKGPGDSDFIYFDLGPIPFERRTNSGPGGYWEAGLWGSGGVDAAQTYAYCAGS